MAFREHTQGALVLSCISIEGEDDLQAATNDVEDLRQFCSDAGFELVREEVKVDLTVEVAKEALQDFFAAPYSTHYVFAIFHGSPTGAWCLHDGGRLGFEDLSSWWKASCSQGHLIIVSDSCYSGVWVDKAAEAKTPGASVQASCHSGLECSDLECGTFTHRWCRVQRCKDYRDMPTCVMVHEQPCYYKCHEVQPHGLPSQATLGIGIWKDCETIQIAIQDVPKADHQDVIQTGTPEQIMYMDHLEDIYSGQYAHHQIRKKAGKRVQSVVA